MSKEIFDSMTDVLLETLSKNDCEAHIYLFMPDHCHLLIEGKTENSDLWQGIVDFKQRSGYWLYKQNYKAKWQKDFYDHILRKNEDVTKQVNYILGNPVRKEMVDSWKDFPFKGSTIYNFDEW
ncbi:MAG: transposase [Candidatus Stahlbacteria bacterium]|nr:transposase [Candidatus Stahlbacteria bacterium]